MGSGHIFSYLSYNVLRTLKRGISADGVVMEKSMWKPMAVFILLAFVLSISYEYFVLGQKEDTLTRTTGSDALAVKSPKYVAITFDDGPKQGTTDVLLEGLKERGVHATFFLIGKQIEGNEDIIRQMWEDGHQIGNHTYSHVNLKQLSAEAGTQELSECFYEVFQVTGQDSCLVRPPFGEVTSTLKKNMECPVVLWSVDTMDWTGKSAGDIADYIVNTAREGDIILLHDIYENSVQGALMAIDAMMEKGYTFVTVTELFEQNGITMEPGKVYRKTY